VVRANRAGMLSNTIRLAGRPWLRLAIPGHGASPPSHVATYPPLG
jgi:hypothetical protein